MTATTAQAWADVALGEYAALAVLRMADPAAAVEAAWSTLDAIGGPPSLTDSGRAMLAAWAAAAPAAEAATDATEARRLARRVLALVGTVTVLRMTRR